jgi:alcohol dehydrogenase class IV
LAALRAGDFDCVIGLGGGSPIDSANPVFSRARMSVG